MPNVSLIRMKVVDLWPGSLVPLAEEGKRQSCSVTEMLPSQWTLRPNPGHTCSAGKAPDADPGLPSTLQQRHLQQSLSGEQQWAPSGFFVNFLSLLREPGYPAKPPAGRVGGQWEALWSCSQWAGGQRINSFNRPSSHPGRGVLERASPHWPEGQCQGLSGLPAGCGLPTQHQSQPHGSLFPSGKSHLPGTQPDSLRAPGKRTVWEDRGWRRLGRAHS